MASRGDVRLLLIGGALALAGAALTGAWLHAMWGSVVGALLIVAWLLVLLWIARPAAALPRGDLRGAAPGGEDGAPLRLLLDQVPTPLVGVEGDGARALNRAARALFATQDHITPVPEPLLSPTAPRLSHAERHWRIDRVEAAGSTGTRTILLLIDIEAEQRVGEARAAAEMIQVMGHEVLNGLAPIVSLADSALGAWQAGEEQRARLMPEILVTLARRAESLQRFTEAYRALARLPDPAPAAIVPDTFLRELTLLFDGRWRGRIALSVTSGHDAPAFVGDRDQLTQAVWALLQNAAEAALAASRAPWVELDMACQTDRVLIRVSDSGEGIPSTQRARIFHPFHTTKPDGTGIGLSLCRQIARAHGGDLQLAASGPTTFVILLPQGARKVAS